jgi:hypothetical protein
MDYFIHSHRFGHELAQSKYHRQWTQLKMILDGISDKNIIDVFNGSSKNKSLSVAINKVLKDRFVQHGWVPESPIFQDSDYQDKRWRLDFAKKDMSIEVAFNHGEAIAWNLIKPALASELNHVKKAMQTELGVVITASAELKGKGGFDSAVGEYEKVLRYLKPFSTILTVPLVVIGLKAPKSFYISHKTVAGRKIGSVAFYK